MLISKGNLKDEGTRRSASKVIPSSGNVRGSEWGTKPGRKGSSGEKLKDDKWKKKSKDGSLERRAQDGVKHATSEFAEKKRKGSRRPRNCFPGHSANLKEGCEKRAGQKKTLD